MPTTEGCTQPRGSVLCPRHQTCPTRQPLETWRVPEEMAPPLDLNLKRYQAATKGFWGALPYSEDVI